MAKGKTIEEFLKLCESRIAARSTAPRKRGKYKGHSDTNAVAWVTDMVKLVQSDIKRRYGRRHDYDGNMALAREVGAVLLLWYANVHRAKTMDPNRPLSVRRRAQKMRNDFLSRVIRAMNDDKLMASVWSGQQFNMPYGRGAKGGKFL